MATSSESSRQKRQRQNRAQREALKARTAAAAGERPSRKAPTPPASKRSPKAAAAAADAKAGAGGKAAAGGTVVDRKGRERPPRLGDRPVDIDSLSGGFVRKVAHVPGGLQVLMAGVLTGVSMYFLLAGKYADPDDTSDKPELVLSFTERFPVGIQILLVGLPVLMVAAAIATSLKPYRRRVWYFAAVTLFLVAITGGGAAAMLYLFPIGMLAFACLRATKVEGRQEPLGSIILRTIRRKPKAPEWGGPAAVEDAAGDDTAS